MRDQWYGDNRDLVKWSVLVELARRFRARRILQVLYYRESEWNGLEIDGKSVPLPQPVVQHFRNVRNIRSLRAPARVNIIGGLFQDRTKYMRVIRKRIRSWMEGPSVVFLDPDTGLASKHPGLQHVLGSELKEIWERMRSGDVLVFYQHQTNRNGLPWIAPKRAQFERCLGLPSGGAKVALAPKIARDVAFFFCPRGSQAGEVAGGAKIG
jgi:hypothetical protein